MLPKLATTRQPLARSRPMAAWISWLSPTVPPGLSIRSSRAGHSRCSTSRRALTTRVRVAAGDRALDGDARQVAAGLAAPGPGHCGGVQWLDLKKSRARRARLTAGDAWRWLLMLLPFALWGTAMAAMKPLLDGAGPCTAGLAAAAARRRWCCCWRPGSGAARLAVDRRDWRWLLLFALVDATAFQGLLARGWRAPAPAWARC
ncbi:MAG UNVERIFIED_CONTAM: hypothetical protein LVQ98_07780 [Rickettsiaceae bacterium]|jgi:hypothetical protein